MSPAGAGPEPGLGLRPVTETDAPAVQAIYALEVAHGTASFEVEPPDEAEIVRRLRVILDAGYPYLAAVRAGQVVGYAYASSYRPRPAYRFTVENSVYVARRARGLGVGRRLLEATVAECTARGFRQMVAIIGDSAHVASITLHERAGFRTVGRLEHVGFKFGRWLDSVVMQRPLGG